MLCHNSLICMRTNKARVARWPVSGHLPSGHLLSGHLSLAFKTARPKRAPHFVTSPVPDHL